MGERVIYNVFVWLPLLKWAQVTGWVSAAAGKRAIYHLQTVTQPTPEWVGWYVYYTASGLRAWHRWKRGDPVEPL